MISTEIVILIVLLLLAGLPLINYNFKIIFVIMIGYLLLFPEQRNILINHINSQKNNKIVDPEQKINKINTLINEGNNIIKELKIYKKKNKSVYTSIKLSWSNLTKLSLNIIENPSQTFQHHIFSSLIDQRKFINEQMAAMIINSEPLTIKENTYKVNPNLPRDHHIRSLIRHMNVIFDHIFEIIKNQINMRWNVNPSTEISPIYWGGPEPFNS